MIYIYKTPIYNEVPVTDITNFYFKMNYFFDDQIVNGNIELESESEKLYGDAIYGTILYSIMTRILPIIVF